MIRILFMSDLHLRKPNDGPFKNLKKAIRRNVDLDSIDAVLLGGDLSDFKNGFKHTLQDIVNDLFPTCPIGVVSGNHDLWGQYWDPSLSSDEVFYNEMQKICNLYSNVVWLEENTIELGNWLLAGTMAWYDYSSKREGPVYISTMPDDFFEQNSASRTMDASCIRFSKSDRKLSQELRKGLTTRIDAKINNPSVQNLAVFTHVPLFKEAIQWKDHSWNYGCQYFYNLTLGDELVKYNKLQLVVSGHTHHGVDQITPRVGGQFQHLVSYADYGSPEAFVIDLEDDGTCSYKRIGMYTGLKDFNPYNHN